MNNILSKSHYIDKENIFFEKPSIKVDKNKNKGIDFFLKNQNDNKNK